MYNIAQAQSNLPGEITEYVDIYGGTGPSSYYFDTNGHNVCPLDSPYCEFSGTVIVDGQAKVANGSSAAPSIVFGTSGAGLYYDTATNSLKIVGYTPVPAPLTGTVSISGSVLVVAGCLSNTTTITGVALGNFVQVAPQSDPGGISSVVAYVSAADTVTVSECSVIGLTIPTTTWNIKVTQ